MNKPFKEKLIESIREASRFDSGNLTVPVAILWPDPERQWEPIIGKLQEDMPELLILGDYAPEKRTGPAIWIKCMVARTLAEANWDITLVPVIYLSGVAKADLKNLSQADPVIAPLMEYQYTGAMWIHRNGKEWTVNGFMQNKEDGMGLTLATDTATRDASLKVLPELFTDEQISYPSHVNADFLYQLLFQNDALSVLEWMCKGDAFMDSMGAEKQQVFTSVCKQKYDFVPNYKNIRSIVERLGMKAGNWQNVWNTFCLTPNRYPQIAALLEASKPDDMGGGLFSVPWDSWPQINDEAEEQLRKALEDISPLSPADAVDRIKELESINCKRRDWVWASMDRSNLAMAIKHLYQLAQGIKENYDATSIESLKEYYTTKGYLVDFEAILALQACKYEKEQLAVKSALNALYTPWLERLTRKFQERVQQNPTIFTGIQVQNETSEFILFVDAFRYDMAMVWVDRMKEKHVKAGLTTSWTPLPSLTPTCKPFVSPVAGQVSQESDCKDFRPRTKAGKDLTPYQFEKELDEATYHFPKAISDITIGEKSWMEVGRIDQYGHQEQAGLVYRIEELFSHIEERIQNIFAAGFRKIKIVTDHGWLLVPGGMPKESLPKDHIETRWGRCAVLKEGIKSELLHLPWIWNPGVMVAYAPGISFFKANNEYAHGGVSLQECLVPVITLETEGTMHQPISVEVKWINLKCTLQISGAYPGCKAAIRTRHTDEKTAITHPKEIPDNGKVVLFVEDVMYENTAAFVVITDDKGIVLDKRQTIVGE